MEGIEYEAYEPDPDDEFYEQMCSAAYSTMFRSDASERDVYDDYQLAMRCLSAS